MGFGTIVAQIIMFISIISLATGMVMVFKNYVDDSSGSLNEQMQSTSNRIRTDITITNVNFDNTTNHTTLNVLNTGKTSLNTDYIDVYLDRMMIPRNTTYRNITVEPSTEVKNTGIWDPNEVLEIVVLDHYLDKDDHSVDVITEYGTGDTETFSV